MLSGRIYHAFGIYVARSGGRYSCVLFFTPLRVVVAVRASIGPQVESKQRSLRPVDRMNARVRTLRPN